MDTQTNASQILQDALHLPLSARAFLAERLLESLDADPEFALSEKWREEIALRCAEIDSGKTTLIAEEHAFAQAFAVLT